MPIAAAIEFGLAYCGLAISRAGRVEFISDEHGCRNIPCTHLLPKDSCSLDWRPELLSLTRGVILVVLQNLKALAEASAGEPVDDVALTLPAFYAHSKRQLISDVAKEAGWNVLRLTSTAVATVMGLFVDSGRPNIRALTLDASSTRVDVTVVESWDRLFEVKCVTGRPVASHQACDQVGQRSFPTDDVNSAVFNASLHAISQALHEADLDKAAVDEVILIGGSINIDKLQMVVAEFLGKSPNTVRKPLEAGLRGAATYAAALSNVFHFRDLLILDAVPDALYVEIQPDLLIQAWPRSASIVQDRVVSMLVGSGQPGRSLRIIEGDLTSQSVFGWFDLQPLGALPLGKRKSMDLELNSDLDGVLSAALTVTDMESGAAMTIPLNRNPPRGKVPSHSCDTRLQSYAQIARGLSEELPLTRRKKLQSALQKAELLTSYGKQANNDHGDSKLVEHLSRTIDEALNGQTISDIEV